MARITVEDCLVKENNRFSLVMLATHRAKQLLSGAKTLIDTKGNKSIVSALREIAASKVRFMTPEDMAEESRLLEIEAERRAKEEADREVAAPAQNGTHRDDIFLSPTPPAAPAKAEDDDGEDDDDAEKPAEKKAVSGDEEE